MRSPLLWGVLNPCFMSTVCLQKAWHHPTSWAYSVDVCPCPCLWSFCDYLARVRASPGDICKCQRTLRGCRVKNPLNWWGISRGFPNFMDLSHSSRPAGNAKESEFIRLFREVDASPKRSPKNFHYPFLPRVTPDPMNKSQQSACSPAAFTGLGYNGWGTEAYSGQGHCDWTLNTGTTQGPLPRYLL